MEVQQVLKKSFPACVMWMQIDAEAPGVEVPMEGIRVYADRIEEDWNRDKLRATFKDKFKWQPDRAPAKFAQA